jgi:hypothetical protein
MPHHVVVDGSNIATEGRSLPSLAQLNEAVMAFMAEHPDALITVVVDATFGHRIDAKEVKEFDEAVANNELVAPPAGAIGRGDAFVLSIANKVNATILTNDSYQEFHGQYDWLFEEGRLIGGKPVPHIGWVFVPRIPVRGAVSRSAMKDAKRRRGPGASKASATMRVGSPEASQPMPVPKAPPPGARAAGSEKAASAAAMADAIAEAARTGEQPAVAPAESGRSGRRRGGRGKGAGAAAAQTAAPAQAPVQQAAPTATQTVNDLLPFLAFVEHHPVGSSVNAIVETYSSHGAYVRVGDVKGYVPLRLMADPAPRSAREFMKIGDAITLVVDSFAPARRSIDLAVAGMSTAKPVAEPPRRGRQRPSAEAAATPATEVVGADTVVEPAPEAPRPARAKRGAKAVAAVEVATPEVVPAKPKAKRAAKAAAAVEVATPEVLPAKPKAKRAAKAVAAPEAAVETVAPEVVPAKPKAKRAAKAVAAPEAAVETAVPEVVPAKPKAKRAAKAVAAPEAAAAPAKRAPRAAKAASSAPAPETAVAADEAPATPVRRRRVH